MYFSIILDPIDKAMVFLIMKAKAKKVRKVLRNLHKKGCLEKNLQEKIISPQKENLKKIPTYDFLCLVGGKKVRLPYEEAKDKERVGIFPQESSNTYVELAETRILRKLADEKKLPTREYFNVVLLTHWQRMNETLLALGHLPLVGDYYATSPNYLSDTNWIVSLRPGCKHCADDFYRDDEMANCRYIGVFNDEE